MKTLSIAALTVGGIPIILYPGVVIATLMGFAGDDFKKVFMLLLVVAVVFQICALAYPWVFYRCYKRVRTLLEEKKEKAALYFSLRPLGYLTFLAALFMLWMQFSTT